MTVGEAYFSLISVVKKGNGKMEPTSLESDRTSRCPSSDSSFAICVWSALGTESFNIFRGLQRSGGSSEEKSHLVHGA